jgi:hypothetical protein
MTSINEEKSLEERQKHDMTEFKKKRNVGIHKKKWNHWNEQPEQT